MKAKSLFVTLALILVSSVISATTVTQTITPASLMAGGAALSDGANSSFSNVTVGALSTIKYAGDIGYVADRNGSAAFYLNSGLNISVTASNYKVKSVTVTWSHGGMSARYNNLYVFSSSNAFVGIGEGYSDYQYSGSVGTYALAYSTSDPTKSVDIDENVKFYMLTSQKTANTFFSQIEIEWEELTEYDVIIGSHANGTIEINDSETPASIEPGEDVTMLLTPNTGYELVSYTIGGATTNLTPAERTTDPVEVHFDMPSGDVTVSAVFSDALARHTTSTYIALDNGEYTAIETSVGTPLVMNVSETLEYLLLVDDTESSAPYTGDISNLSYSWATGGIASVTTFTYNGGIGEGALVIEGVAMGTDVLTINFMQTNALKASSLDIYVKVEVPTHTAALVAEVDGRYYALTKTITAGKLGAEEVIVANGKVFYDAYSISASDISWVISETTNAYGDPAYAIQKAADDNYLSRSGANFTYQADVQLWDDTDGKPTLGSRWIGFNADRFEVSADASAGVYEIASINAMPAAFERTQPNGKYSTFCFPFPINLESPFIDGIGTVYNITGVYKSGDKVTGIALEEEASKTLAAGTPYIFETTSSDLYVQFGEATTAATRGYATGLVGNLEAGKIYVPDDGYCYGISNNQIRRVLPGASASVGQYKAYINVDGLAEVGASPAPGRRVLYAEDTATSIEDLLENATFINWNEPVYNTLGQQVGKGSTGVLIQNGQKFLVQ